MTPALCAAEDLRLSLLVSLRPALNLPFPFLLDTHPQPNEYETVRLIQRLLEEQKRKPKHIYTAQMSRLRNWDFEHRAKPRFVPNRDAAELRGCNTIVGPDDKRVEEQVRSLHCLARDAELKPHYVSYSEVLADLGFDAKAEEEKIQQEEGEKGEGMMEEG